MLISFRKRDHHEKSSRRQSLMILKDIVSSLKLDARVRDIRQGIFYTGVLSQQCGLAATLIKDALQQRTPLVKTPGALLNKPASELVQLAFSNRIAEAAIGMATINSLVEIDESICVERNAADLIVEKGSNKRVVIVGHFPFIPKVRKAAEKLWVIEKNPQKDDFPESETTRLIPKADVLAVTGTAFTNHTLDHLLKLRNPKAFVVILGGTTPMLPILFDYGIHAVSGTKVVDPMLALQCISQGANFRQIKGTKRLTIMR
jgi:uncharacterized protein (DUF4213/DUF364 family)